MSLVVTRLASRTVTRSAAAAAVATLVALPIVLTMTAGPAAAAALPWQDPRSKGYLAFCDHTGHSVTSGNVNDLPFVGTAISSVALPAGYAVKNVKATLVAYQPRREVQPDGWSGQQLSGSSSFSNQQHPMAAVTTGDKPLVQYLQAFPASWDGLVQLRMYISAPGMQTYTVTYPTTTIKVAGTRWSVVDGGAAISCSVGKAQSIETAFLPPSSFPSPSVAPRTSAPSAPAGSTTDASASTDPGSGDVAAAGAQTTKNDDPGSSTSPVLVGLLGLAIGGAAVGVVAWLRSRRA